MREFLIWAVKYSEAEGMISQLLKKGHKIFFEDLEISPVAICCFNLNR